MSPTCISRIISGHAHAIMHARPSTLLLLLGTRIILVKHWTRWIVAYFSLQRFPAYFPVISRLHMNFLYFFSDISRVYRPNISDAHGFLAFSPAFSYRENKISILLPELFNIFARDFRGCSHFALNFILPIHVHYSYRHHPDHRKRDQLSSMVHDQYWSCLSTNEKVTIGL